MKKVKRKKGTLSCDRRKSRTPQCNIKAVRDVNRGTVLLEPTTSLSVNTGEVLKARYLLKNDRQETVETPEGLFKRVARHIAAAENNFKTKSEKQDVEKMFYNMMAGLEFLPNSPTLMNAGTSLGQLSACFVIPVEDSMEGIFAGLNYMARIHQTGGGTGFDFSHLRPKGDLVRSTKGQASGPVSFMSIYDQATGVIVQGGRRRGANMGILRCDHPDIFEFVRSKLTEGRFSNFNLSVGITDVFLDAVKKGKKFDLVNPRTKKSAATVQAAELFNAIVDSAWASGDPGLVFLDEINRYNPTPGIGRIEATNPCGELPLLPYESCNLGSINLEKVVKGDAIDWPKLAYLVKWGIRFLDNVVEVNKYPLPEIRKITLANRKIGLGVMGFADMLVKLGISYADEKAVSIAKKLMSFIHEESIKASSGLAKTRGAFPNYKKSIYPAKKLKLRNATVNTIAPTGSISIIAGCSSGIEPLFAVSFMRNILSGKKLSETNPFFEETAKKIGFYSEDLMKRISRTGSVREMEGVPEDVKKIFVTAFDVPAKQHLDVQAAFQRYTDNSVSKTINLAEAAARDDIRGIYLAAHGLKCKGITVYRYGTKQNQTLSFDYEKPGVTAGSEYSGGCVYGTCSF